MAEIFLEVKKDIQFSANDFVNYLCRVIMNHLEDKVCGLSGNYEWEDGSNAQMVFKLNISREEADELVSTINDDEGEDYGTWFLADEDQ